MPRKLIRCPMVPKVSSDTSPRSRHATSIRQSTCRRLVESFHEHRNTRESACGPPRDAIASRRREAGSRRRSSRPATGPARPARRSTRRGHGASRCSQAHELRALLTRLDRAHKSQALRHLATCFIDCFTKLLVSAHRAGIPDKLKFVRCSGRISRQDFMAIL